MSNVDDFLPPSGQKLTTALRSLVVIFEGRSIQYAIIGGIATIQHTRVRTTNDIDARTNRPTNCVPGLFESLEAGGFTVDLQKNIHELRDEGMTSIRFGDVLVDLMWPVLPVYAHVLADAVRVEILGQSVRVSSIEGLIVMKLIAFQPQDEADIKDLIAAHRGRLSVDRIRAEFASVADPDDPRWAKLDSWLGGPQVPEC